MKLKNIVKIYGTEDNKVNALRGVSIDFRENELVSILGPSGCGKTTLLNIIGGLDKYTSGDLVINGKSTKDFTDYDWDVYRNQRIGFVFQNYNLIPHLSVLGNVEIALTLSGISAEERRERSIKALQDVGIADQMKKRPNQLSGGQMQRVAIARAIVNNPDIILADEPTGALDSVTSVQVMDILKELSKDRLVIMVTHNNNLAKEYSTRIIELLDGEMTKDTSPFTIEDDNTSNKDEELGIAENNNNNIEIGAESKDNDTNNKDCDKKSKNPKKDKTAMSFFTAFKLSLKNLVSKRTRTILTSFAGSIGIIGVALVLAVSNGFNNYIVKLQSDTLSGYPINISTISADMDQIMEAMETSSSTDKREEFPDEDVIYVKDTSKSLMAMGNFSFISPTYMDYLNDYYEKDSKKPKSEQAINDVQYSYGTHMTVIGKSGNKYVNISQPSGASILSTSYFNEGLNSKAFVESQYDVIYGSYPTKYNELALVISSTNEVSIKLLDSLAIPYTRNADGTISNINFSDIVTNDSHTGIQYKMVYNDDFYKPNTNNSGKIVGFTKSNEGDYGSLYNNSNSLTLTISGIFRVKEGSVMSLYSNGLVYTPMLSDHFRQNAKQSLIVQEQLNLINQNPYADFYFPYIPSVGDMALDDYGCTNVMAVKLAVMGLSGVELTNEQIAQYVIQQYGASDIPENINIYPTSFDAKSEILAYLQAWNDNPANAKNKVYFTDVTAILGDSLSQLVDTVSYVLIAFASISLVVSSIMIGIITYVSVVERTKEIGVLRALGARKKDIRRVFNAETLIIGFAAGFIGVLVSVLLSIPISIIIASLSSGMVQNIASLTIGHGIALVLISMTLTLISGLIPAQIAGKKDPVVALRTE